MSPWLSEKSSGLWARAEGIDELILVVVRGLNCLLVRLVETHGLDHVGHLRDRGAIALLEFALQHLVVRRDSLLGGALFRDVAAERAGLQRGGRRGEVREADR